MTSYTSWIPSSSSRDSIPTHQYNSSSKIDNSNGPKQQQQQQQKLSPVHEENMRLKASLTRVQSEYEELRDESNYQHAKVTELSDLVSIKQQQQGRSSSNASSNYNYHSSGGRSNGSNNNKNGSNECGESTVHNRLIDTSLENAELNLSVDKLKTKVRVAEMKLQELQTQKRSNNKLLLEMGDVVRTLNSIHIEYNSTSVPNESAQQSSIKKIKLKVEAIIEERALLARRCKELEEETYNQQQHIKVLEAQFHVLNTTNLSQGVALGDAVTHTTNGSKRSVNGAPHSPFSSSYSTVSRMTSDTQEYDESSIMMNSIGQRSPTKTTTTNKRSQTVEYVRQSKELDRIKKHEKEQSKELNDLKKSQETQKNTIRRLREENVRTNKRMQSIKKELSDCNEKKEDAIINRDEFKANLGDIVEHYKKLNSTNTATHKQLELLQSYVDKLNTELQEAKSENQRQQVLREKVKEQLQKAEKEKTRQEAEEEEEEQTINKNQDQEDENDDGITLSSSTSTVTTPATEPSSSSSSSSSSSNDDVTSCKMEDLIIAYGRAMNKIESLEQNIEMAERGAVSSGQDGLKNNSSSTTTTIRNQQRDAINRLVKMEKERNDFQRKLDKALEETRLAKMEAQKEREEAKHVRRRLTLFLQKKKNDDTEFSSPSLVAYKATMMTTQQKQVAFKPLTIEEMMKKDFV